MLTIGAANSLARYQWYVWYVRNIVKTGSDAILENGLIAVQLTIRRVGTWLAALKGSPCLEEFSDLSTE